MKNYYLILVVIFIVLFSVGCIQQEELPPPAPTGSEIAEVVEVPKSQLACVKGNVVDIDEKPLSARVSVAKDVNDILFERTYQNGIRVCIL